LNAGERSMLEVCVAATTLAVDVLLPLGTGSRRLDRRRFDTRFVAPAPPGQDPSHDGWETTGSWMRPIDVLAAADRGHVDLIEPTLMLSALTNTPPSTTCSPPKWQSDPRPCLPRRLRLRR
jgi:hypothetical protein